MIYNFKVESITEECVEWIRNWFRQNGNENSVAVIGMSGGKDSTIAAALIKEAIGADRVIGVAIPQGEQSINDADKICEYLGIKYMCVNIGYICNTVVSEISMNDLDISKNTILNIPPRIRMTVLYAIAQSCNGFVINTCNYSENWLGYETKFGDGAGDMSPLGQLTVTEILKIGDYLGLPYEWVHKTPDDGLPHSTSDEEKLGFTYAELDNYLRKGVISSDEMIQKAFGWHNSNKHKMNPIPEFKSITL